MSVAANKISIVLYTLVFLELVNSDAWISRSLK